MRFPNGFNYGRRHMNVPVRRRWWFGVTLATTVVAALTITAVASSPTVFADDFSDGNLTGWSRSGGSWSVVTDGSLVARQSSTRSTARALAGSTTWTNYSVQARVRPVAFNGSDRYAALLGRAQSFTNHYYLA